jgi:hypothetical protein
VDGAANANAPSDNEGRDAQPTRSRSHLEDIEQGFWDSRESLKMVWQTSMANLVPPWAVLAICTARGLSQVRPHVVLPPVISRRGSLNWFGAIVAGPAGGKTTSGEVAEYLVPGHILTCYQGTGEGILASFGQAGDPGDPNSVPEHEAIMLDVDEVDTLVALNQRSASTTLTVLRSGFMGETLGFSYADKSKRRNLRAHTYRMTLVVAVQPKRAGGLLSDEGGGTPQRFMWFPAKDSRISMDERWPGGELKLPDPKEWLYPREIQIPSEAAYLLRLNRVKDANDDQDALDGHALFCREKFAYSLAVMDGRTNMTLEDWELSGIAADVSAYTRQLCIEQLSEAARMDAIDRGEVRGVEMAATEAAKAHEQVERVRRVLRRLLAAVDEAGPDGILKGDLSRKIGGRDRRYLEPAIKHAESSGLIRYDEGMGRWVKI